MTTKGHCLCGNVQFETDAAPQGACVCHCGQCRRQTGHLWASAYVPKDALRISGDVTWFAASDLAKRGFCATCGTVLFWAAHAEDTISFSLGGLETPTGLTLTKHIFVENKGDYYDIADGLPQEQRG